MRQIFYNQAIAEALAEEMRRDPLVVLWGIDIGPYGGANAATKGLFEEFGAESGDRHACLGVGVCGSGCGRGGGRHPARH